MQCRSKNRQFSHQPAVELSALALDQLPDMVLFIQPDTQIFYANQRACQQLAYDAAELLQTRFCDIVPSLTELQWSSYWQKLQQQKSCTISLDYQTSTEQQLAVEVKLTYIANAETEYACAIATPRPVLSETQVTSPRQQEQFLQSVYDGSEHLIFVVDVLAADRFQMVGWNLATERVTGLTSRQIAGKSPLEVFGDVEGRKVHQHYARCVSTGTAITYEECLYLQDRETWWFTTLNPLRDEDGRIVRLVGTTSDITERKRAEAKIHLQAAKLRQHNAVLNVLTHKRALAEGDWEESARLITAATACTLKTERVSLWLYDQPQQPTALHCMDLYRESCNCHSPAAPLQVADFPSYFNALQQEKIIVAQEALTDLRLREFVDCYLIPLGITAMLDSPIRVGGDIVGVLCIEHVGSPRHWEPEDEAFARSMADLVALAMESRDRKQARAALQESEQQLRQQAEHLQHALDELQRTHAQMVQSEKMSSLGQLVAGVAHEINNPVNFIYGNLTHAREYTQDLVGLVELYQQCYPAPLPEVADEIEAIDLEFLKDDLPQLLNSMKVGADRIQQIVTSLRTFSRMDEAEMKAVNIHEGIDSTLMILHNRTKAKPERRAINVNRHYGTLPLVECYAGQLNQVFMNLLSNAIDALDDVLHQQPRFAAAIDIYTEATDTNHVTIRICDNGTGMPTDVKQHIFDPFFTTKPIGKGTGMGLSISFQIITEKHGGTLTCVSQPDQGTEFVITIPLHQQAQAAA